MWGRCAGPQAGQLVPPRVRHVKQAARNRPMRPGGGQFCRYGRSYVAGQPVPVLASRRAAEKWADGG